MVNDAPTESSIEGGSVVYTENDGAVAITSTLAISDVDDASLESAVVAISVNYASGEDILAFTDQNGITGAWNATTGELTLTGLATLSQYETALRTVTYSNTSDAPSLATRTVSFAINDGDASSSVQTRDIEIAAVNDAPAGAAIESTSVAYTENDGAVAITSALSISDVDDTHVESAVVLISANYATGQDVLAFADQNGITGSWNASTGELTLTGSATLSHYETALRTVTYNNTSEDPSTATRTVSFTVDDGDANSNTLTRNIEIDAVNDAAVEISIEGSALAYTENDGSVAVTSTIAITDVDDADIESAVVVIVGNYADGEDVLGFVDQNGITGSWNAATAELTLTGSATLNQYETALRSVTYSNTSENPSAATRTVSFAVNDGDATSNTLTRDIDFTAVNDAPAGATIENAPLAYTENDGAVAITSTLAISDVDDTSLESAVVAISTNYASGEDVLVYVDQSGISGVWDATVGELTLTGAASLADYNAALRSITYGNTSETPATATRTVSFTVSDGDTNSVTLTRDITVTPVNDAPTESSVEGTSLGYTENDPGIGVTSTLSIDDLDDTTIESAVVGISTNYHAGEDVLAFVDQGGITGSWSAITGELTLTGSASLENYETALRSITYSNTSDDPSAETRTVSFVVNDGDANSNVQTREIDFTTINDLPLVTSIEGSAIAYAENDGPVAITSMLAISDPDDTNIDSAVVAITANYASGEDLLAFVDQSGITGSWDASTGELTLTGSASLANYQAALRGVTYSNASENPSTATRTVSFTVNDGAIDSATVTRDLQLTAVNDAPVEFNVETAALGYTENDGAVVVTSTITVTDADDAYLESAVVGITTGYVNGEEVLAFSDQSGITGWWNAAAGELTLTGSATVADYQNALRSITYTNSSETPSVAPRTVGFTVNDGNTDSDLQTREIAVTAVNDAPVAQNDSAGILVGESVSVDAAGGLLENDADIEGDALTAVLIAGPSSGNLTVNADGSWHYTPAPGFYGTVYFTYAASDGVDNSAAATVTINVTVGTAPDPAPDPGPDPVPILPQDPGLRHNPGTEYDSGWRQESQATSGVWEGDQMTASISVSIDSRFDFDLSNALIVNSTSSDSNTGVIVNLEVTTHHAFDLELFSAEEVARLNFVIDDSDLRTSFQEFSDANADREELLNLVSGTASSLFAGAATVFALWTISGAYLTSLLFSSMPVWAGFDPIHVVSNPTLVDEDDGDATLAQIVEDQESSEPGEMR